MLRVRGQVSTVQYSSNPVGHVVGRSIVCLCRPVRRLQFPSNNIVISHISLRIRHKECILIFRHFKTKTERNACPSLHSPTLTILPSPFIFFAFPKPQTEFGMHFQPSCENAIKILLSPSFVVFFIFSATKPPPPLLTYEPSGSCCLASLCQ